VLTSPGVTSAPPRSSRDSASGLGPLPTAATADQLLTVARGLGYEHRDIAGLFEVVSQLADEETHSLA